MHEAPTVGDTVHHVSLFVFIVCAIWSAGVLLAPRIGRFLKKD